MPRLRTAGVLDGVRWAYDSAVRRALDDYSEDAGYDTALLGSLRFTLFRDRLDRVFSCGRYALQAGVDENVGLDLVRVELTDKDRTSMPVLPADLVRRVNRDGSPGWALGDLQFLLASCEFGKIDILPWPRRSPAKQQVAMQLPPATEQPLALFDVVDTELAESDQTAPSLTTFMVAHTLDAVSGRRELVFGRTRFNSGGGQAWYWYENLLTLPPTQGGQRPSVPTPSGPDGVPDAPVRLRKVDSTLPKASDRQ